MGRECGALGRNGALLALRWQPGLRPWKVGARSWKAYFQSEGWDGVGRRVCGAMGRNGVPLCKNWLSQSYLFSLFCHLTSGPTWHHPLAGLPLLPPLLLSPTWSLFPFISPNIHLVFQLFYPATHRSACPWKAVLPPPLHHNQPSNHSVALNRPVGCNRSCPCSP